MQYNISIYSERDLTLVTRVHVLLLYFKQPDDNDLCLFRDTDLNT